MKKIFVINPGCTSTKVAVYEDERAVWTSDGLHPQEELDQFTTVNEQYEYRKNFVLKLLKEAGIPLEFDAVIGRGGLLKPLHGGVYAVNEQMKQDLINAKHKHVCNLGSPHFISRYSSTCFEASSISLPSLPLRKKR